MVVGRSAPADRGDPAGVAPRRPDGCGRSTAAAVLADRRRRPWLVLGAGAVMVVRSFQTPTGWGLDNYRALAGLGDGNMLLVPVTSALWNSVRAATLAAVLAVTRRHPAVGGVGPAAAQPVGRAAAGRRHGRGGDAAAGGVGGDGRLRFPHRAGQAAAGSAVRSAAGADGAGAWWPPRWWCGWCCPVLRAADDRLRQAAAVLGAARCGCGRRVDLPIMSRALIGAAAFAFAVALGEFGATSFLARPQRSPCRW